MINIRKNVFETNSSSTHSLILTNEQYMENISEGDLLTLVNLPELEATITIFDGTKTDRTYNNKKYSTEEGNFTNIVDKLRYLYTCMCQSGLYYRSEETNDYYLDDSSDAYLVYLKITEFLPKVKFIPPKEGYCYIFEDCEYIIEDILKYKLFDSIKTLGLFLLKGQVVYCNRDEDSELSDELHEICRKNKYSICVSG